MKDATAAEPMDWRLDFVPRQSANQVQTSNVQIALTQTGGCTPLSLQLVPGSSRLVTGTEFMVIRTV